MTATLKLNLGDVLNADELREITDEAERQHKPLERLLFEAAKDLVMRRRAARTATPPTPPALPA